MGQQGYKSQYLIGPNEYIQPSPATSGYITKFYIYISTSGGPIPVNQLTIKMGQATITSFPPAIYTGQLDTVYHRDTAMLSAVINTWLSFTLDNPFTYDSTKSLIIEISHCSFTGAGFNIWQSAGTTGINRRVNIPGNSSCIFTFLGADTRTIQSGIDISSTVGTGNNNNNVPSEYKLYQNFPNPFNPITTISFDIVKPGNVELIIYDALGRETASLVNEFRKTGSYSVNFDASELTSGVYFYTLRSAEFTETKKLVLVK